LKLLINSKIFRMVALSIFETQNENEDLEEEDSVEEEGEPVAEVEKNEPEGMVAEEGTWHHREQEDEEEEQIREGGGREDAGPTSTFGRNRSLSDAEEAGSKVTKKTPVTPFTKKN
jgi:PHD/YefM family antitoxin component YafN of YafNO toxin-antitoxin module